MRDLVLVGAGHAHVQILKMAAMEPLPARVTLIVDRPVAVYSGMVPGLVAGRYRAEELEIDARPLARRAGVRMIHARVERVDPVEKRVHIVGRPPIAYDLCSLNVGSTVAGRELPGVLDHAVPTRPIRLLLDGLEQRMQATGPEPEVVVVGAGAGGIELAFCVEQRLRDLGRRPRVTLAFRGDRPLPGGAPAVRTAIEQIARQRGIQLAPHTTVTEVTADRVVTSEGGLPSDLTIWVTGAAAHGIGRASGLPVDSRGFIFVGDDLRVEGHADLFAVGDCAVLRSWPEIPKAGVYAVREGPVLLDNLRRLLTGRTLRPYRPQRDFFSILNLGDGTALGTKWGRQATGAWMMTYKDWIDRRFLQKFQVLAPDHSLTPDFSAPMPGAEEMVCGGCAAKVAQSPLQRALARLPPLDEPRIAVGPREAEDVVAWRDDEQLIVQNLDAFSAFTDDPWLVGRVAANNALSDVQAKGLVPDFAMALVQIPRESDHEETLFQVMAGLRSALDDEEVALLGGHTTVGEELQVGLAVTGTANALRWRLDGAHPGDGLVLTRPLGTGVLFHADMAGRAPGLAVDDALRTMQIGNGRASRLAGDHPIHAATDVTGFGLAGHLAELVRASSVGAEVDLESVPTYPAVAALLAHGERSTFHEENREVVKAVEVAPTAAQKPLLEVLFDPQTAGGLLFATPDPEGLAARLEAGGETAWVIGRVTEPLASGGLFRVS